MLKVVVLLYNLQKLLKKMFLRGLVIYCQMWKLLYHFLISRHFFFSFLLLKQRSGSFQKKKKEQRSGNSVQSQILCCGMLCNQHGYSCVLVLLLLSRLPRTKYFFWAEYSVGTLTSQSFICYYILQKSDLTVQFQDNIVESIFQ